MKPSAALKRFLLVFVFLSLLTICLHAQQILNRTISLSVKDVPLGDVLDTISNKGKVFFSFPTTILPLHKKISFMAEQETIAEILGSILGEEYTYAVQGKYIILHETAFYIISGYVTDAVSGIPLEQVSIAVPDEQKTAATDTRGFFSIRLSRNHKRIAIIARKMGYEPVSQSLRAGAQSLSLHLQPALVELQPVEIKSRSGSVSGRLANSSRLNTPGVKFGGLFNVNNGAGGPLQLSFIVNVANKSYTGLQMTSLHNVIKDTLDGVQVAGLINKVEGDMRGLQFSAFNYARRSKGLQIGAVNVVDSAGGWSLGMLNVVKGEGGYRRLSFFTSGIMNSNVSLKTGNARLYNIWMFGKHLWPSQKITAIGVGLGHDFLLAKKIKLSGQLVYHVISSGYGFENRLWQVKLLPEYQLSPNISLYGGVTANRYKNRDVSSMPGYRNIAEISNDRGLQNIGKIKNWLGWEFGITYDPRYNYTETTVRQPGAWNFSIGLGLGLTSRTGLTDQVTGFNLRAEKNIFEDISFTLTSGYNYVKSYNRKIVPVTAGLKVFQGRFLYVAGECGAAVHDFRKLAFVFAPSTGLNYKDKIDLSVRCDFYGSRETHLGLRLAYSLGFL